MLLVLYMLNPEVKKTFEVTFKLRKHIKAEDWSQMKDQLGGPTENWNPIWRSV